MFPRPVWYRFQLGFKLTVPDLLTQLWSPISFLPSTGSDPSRDTTLAVTVQTVQTGNMDVHALRNGPIGESEAGACPTLALAKLCV